MSTLPQASSRGGAETVLYSLIQATQDTYEHTVLYVHSGPFAQRLIELGVPIYQVRGFLSTWDPWLVLQTVWLLRKLKPDLIHSLLFGANVITRCIAKALSVPSINAVHNNSEQDGLVRNIFNRLTLPLSNRVVAVSSQVAVGVKKLYPYARVIVIKNGIDTQAIAVNAARTKKYRKELGFQDHSFVIGAVGRFEPVKQFPFLLEAFALLIKNLPHARLILVGYGAQEHALRKQVRHLNLTEWVVFIVGESALGYYPLFDVFVQPSDQEGISLALLEAMCLGMPVVVMGKEQHPVIVHGSTGFINPPGCVKSLVQTLKELNLNSDLRQRLGMQAHRFVRDEYEQRTMVDAYKKLFSDCLIDNC